MVAGRPFVLYASPERQPLMGNAKNETDRPEQTIVQPLTVSVRSSTDVTKSYIVTLPHCPCTGFHFHGTCAHLRTALEKFGHLERVDKATVPTEEIRERKAALR